MTRALVAMTGRVLPVLQHALGRDTYGRPRSTSGDYRNYFCADDGSDDFNTCVEAARLGLMVDKGATASSGGGHVFVVTPEGKAYVAQRSPAAPRVSPARHRYQMWLSSGAADAGVPFGAWLRAAMYRLNGA